MTDPVERYRREVEASPDDPAARSNLGTILFQRGRREEALEQYRRAEALAPDNSVIVYNLANTLRELGRFDEAAALCRRALGLSAPRPVAVAAALCLGDCLKASGRTEEALDQYRATLELDRRHGPAHYNLANTLRDLGRTDEALGHYRLALEGQHDRQLAVSIHVNLGALLERLGRAGEAAGHYEKALEISPQDRFAAAGLARLRGAG